MARRAVVDPYARIWVGIEGDIRSAAPISHHVDNRILIGRSGLVLTCAAAASAPSGFVDIVAELLRLIVVPPAETTFGETPGQMVLPPESPLAAKYTTPLVVK